MIADTLYPFISQFYMKSRHFVSFLISLGYRTLCTLSHHNSVGKRAFWTLSPHNMTAGTLYPFKSQYCLKSRHFVPFHLTILYEKQTLCKLPHFTKIADTLYPFTSQFCMKSRHFVSFLLSVNSRHFVNFLPTL